MTHTLDFALLPDVKYGHTFMRLDAGVASAIAPLKRVSERAHNAIRFAAWSAGSSETLRCPEEEVQRLREGCFRAALTEFAAIEDIHRLDYHDLGVSRSTLKLNQTQNPLLHIFRELRNLEVHLRHGELCRLSKDVLWGHVDRPHEARALTIDVWLLDGVTSQSFGELRNAKYYTSDQIDRMISWFNSAQNEWGIQELFLRAVGAYCILLKP